MKLETVHSLGERLALGNRNFQLHFCRVLYELNTEQTGTVVASGVKA